ncbi:hypothetical protein ScPMuIL_013519 [Solemya velum]
MTIDCEIPIHTINKSGLHDTSVAFIQTLPANEITTMKPLTTVLIVCFFLAMSGTVYSTRLTTNPSPADCIWQYKNCFKTHKPSRFRILCGKRLARCMSRAIGAE